MEDAELIGRQMPQIESGVPLPKRIENPNKIPNLDTHFGPWDSVQDGMTVMNAYGKPGRLFGVKGSVLDEDVTSYEVDYYVYRGQSLAPRLLGSSNGSISIQISVTKSELDDLITDNELVPNVLYEISGCDESLYGGTTLYLRAISTNKLETSGIGKFYNPKYDKEVEGYGIFDIDTSYDVDDTCIWGGKHWICIAVNEGQEPIDQFTLDTKAWQEIPYNDTDYNVAYDEIKYDYENDWIAERHEVAGGNIVSCSYNTFLESNDNWGVPYSGVKVFQWGNEYDLTYYSGLFNNNINESFFECINSKFIRVNANTLMNCARFLDNKVNNGTFSQNTLDGCLIQFNTFTNVYFDGNNIQVTSSIYECTFTDVYFTENILRSITNIMNVQSSDISISKNIFETAGINSKYNGMRIIEVTFERIYNLSSNIGTQSRVLLSRGRARVLANSNSQVVIQYINENNQLTITPITS